VAIALCVSAGGSYAQEAADDPGPGSPATLGTAREFNKLLQDYVSLAPPPFRGSQEDLKEWRAKISPELVAIIARAEALSERSSSPDVLLLLSLCHAKRANVLLDDRRELDRRIGDMTDGGAEIPDDLRRAQATSSVEAAREYGAIETTLRRALDSADALRQRREIGLVQGVILAQTAIVQDRALELTEAAGISTDLSADRLRPLLDDAQELLQSYLEATALENGLEWVRGRFYLGVVEYRRSLTVRVMGEEHFTEVDPAREASFERAREIFTTLSTPEAVLRILEPHGDEAEQRQSPAGRAYETSSFRLQADYSYEAVAKYYAASSSLYLGLIAAIDPAFEGRPAQERFDSTQAFMDQAAALDLAEPSPGQAPISLTANTVPISRRKVMKELKRALEAPSRQPINDVSFSIGGGYLWDTNVTLLGDRTALPQNLPRKSDSRFPTRLRLSWVADLDAFDAGNEALRKWQIFVEGRIDSTWNRDIKDFNEELYGGTVNIRYELAGPEMFEKLDGLYLHVRYDYDHIVLGHDGFLTLNRVRPMIQYLAGEGLIDGSLFFAYENRDYSETLSDPRFNRDGNYLTAGTDLRIDLGEWVDAEKLWGTSRVWGPLGPSPDDGDYRRPMEVAFGYEFASNSTRGDEFDYSSQIGSVGVLFPLPLGVDFLVSGAWEWQNYWHHSLIDRKRGFRTGMIQEYSFRLDRKFYLTDYPADYAYVRPLQLDRVVMSLFSEIRWVIDDNNVVDRLGQSPFEYDRAVYGVGFKFELN
jgi:hypothetical protein